MNQASRRGIRVVHITTVHRPFDARIFHKQCVSLARAGFDVTLIQGGETDEVRENVKIVPLGLIEGRIRRTTVGVWRAAMIARRLRADVVHFHDIELIWAGLLLKLIGTAVVIYDVHEDVAKDLQDKAYLPQWARWPISLGVRLFEWLACKMLDHASAATSAIAARFPPEFVTLIRNTPIVGEMARAEMPDFTDRPMRAVYLGGLAAFNGPLAMVNAFALLPDRLGARLTLGGVWPDPDVEARTKSLAGWSYVDFVGWVDRKDVGSVFAQSRCGLILYEPTPNVIESEPNKFFECMSAGLPIIVSNFPIWRRLIEQIGCGICVDPGDYQAIADAITWIMDNPHEAQAMGARGREAVLGGYNWDVDAKNLVAMYNAQIAAKVIPNA